MIQSPFSARTLVIKQCFISSVVCLAQNTNKTLKQQFYFRFISILRALLVLNTHAESALCSY